MMSITLASDYQVQVEHDCATGKTSVSNYPSNEAMRKWVKGTTPQEWWDSNDDPFTPAEPPEYEI